MAKRKRKKKEYNNTRQSTRIRKENEEDNYKTIFLSVLTNYAT